MWPWRRTPPEPVPAPLSAPEPVAAPVRRDAWRSLPVIQRTIGDHPLVDPPGRFGASLGSWQDPSYLAPLGHAVGPDEPAGLIGELAVPVGEPRVRDESPPDLPVATPPPAHPPTRPLPGGTGAETPTPRAVQRLADSAPVVADPPATSSPPPAEPPTTPPSYDEPDEQPAMAEEPSPASAADPPAEAPESAPTL